MKWISNQDRKLISGKNLYEVSDWGFIIQVKEPGVLPGSTLYISSALDIDFSMHSYFAMGGHYNCVVGYQIKRDYYEHILLAYIKQGTMELEYEGNYYEANQGDLMLINCRKAHRYAAKNNMEFVFIHFGGEVSTKICDELNKKYGPILDFGNNDYVYRRIMDIMSLHQNRQYTSPLILSSIVYDILCNCYPLESSSGFKKNSDAVGRAIELMKYRIANGESISVSEIADAAHMSKYHFSRIFRKEVGESPYEHFIRLRLNKGKHLLSTTNMTIEEIALTLGYRSGASFTALFTEKIGLSPSEYRNHPI